MRRGAKRPGKVGTPRRGRKVPELGPRRGGPGDPAVGSPPPRPRGGRRLLAGRGARVCRTGQRDTPWPAVRRARPTASSPRRRTRPGPSRHHAEGECAPPRRREGAGERESAPLQPGSGPPGAMGEPRGGTGQEGLRAGRPVSLGRGRGLGVGGGALRTASAGYRGPWRLFSPEGTGLIWHLRRREHVGALPAPPRGRGGLFPPHPAPLFWGEPLPPRPPSRLGSPLRSELGASLLPREPRKLCGRARVGLPRRTLQGGVGPRVGRVRVQ